MKKLVIGGAIAAVLLVAAVWIGFDLFLVEKVDPITTAPSSVVPHAVPSTKVTPPRDDVQKYLDGIAKSLRKGETASVADQFDLPRLYSHAVRYNLSPDPSLPKLIGSQHARLYPALMEAFARGGFGLPWDRIEFEQFLETPQGDLVASVLQISGDRVVPVWWWLVPTKDGFLIADVEDRLLGLRVSHQFALLLGTGMAAERAEKVSEAAKSIRDAAVLLGQDRSREADLNLGTAKRTLLPAVHTNAVLALEGLAVAAVNDPERAETIAATLGDVPVADLIRAMAAGGEGWLEKRLNAAGKYELAIGPTPLTMSVRIQALMLRDKTAEASELLDVGLKRFPDSPTLLAWATVLP